jgi:two-component system, OmpR family, phosphate regulon response regulator PhoB
MEPQAKRRARILVVDDECAIRELLKLQLSANGYDVVLAEDAFAARRMLYEAQPELMIVDAHMPYMSGVEFVSTLVAEPSLPWVPVIFITGREELLERAATLGSACLVKPFLAERLIELIERVLASQERYRNRAPLGEPQERPSQQSELRAA